MPLTLQPGRRRRAIAAEVDRLRAALVGGPDEVVDSLSRRMAALAQDERFEEAGSWRDRLSAFLRGVARTQRLRALTRCAEVVAARRENGQWSVHVIRHGRLTAAGVIPPGAHAGDWVLQLRAAAETVLPGPGPTPAATAEETERILRWLESDGVRLVHVDGEWAARSREPEPVVQKPREQLVPFDDVAHCVQHTNVFANVVP